MAIITITRAAYSDGDKIAENVAQRTGYTCIRRKELIYQAAEDFEFPETKLVEAMEEPPRLWQRDRDKRDAHFNLIRAAFLRRCHNADIVYHGFSGQELIRGIAHGFRILIIADEAYQTENAMAALSIERDEAAALIHKSNKKLNEWTRQMYGLDWKNPFLYDMIFQMGRISIENAIETIVQTLESGAFNPTADSQEAFDNELLCSMVWSTLTKNEKTKKATVQIMARNGSVTIIGVAPSPEVLEDIKTVAEQVEGVNEVNLQVSTGSIWRS
jgi:cytidylate kinase